ncbi:DUF423 domain-containing protein [Phenylobacterium montanum]|uniref:DUF423 domain-containing protein n=1 Tax=Phenylobacterium montanum TaxID=2823693 RepID=A0A975IWM1_9CAUL|nr:DUF423 domain-containing protein [Caulobacter sp. S6]QUD89985.1 DUF423 domain-containing protein [Caulobacter sp. S6]
MLEARPATRADGAVIAGAGLLGFSAVAAGAFGAHSVADPTVKMLIQTGGHYALAHALAALAAIGVVRFRARPARWAAGCFLAGGAVFSGSLYALALGGVRWLGAITPIGGLLMLAGWALLAWSGLTLKAER